MTTEPLSARLERLAKDATPGRWDVLTDREQTGFRMIRTYVLDGASGDPVAHIQGNGAAEEEANARLIAAAPELLEGAQDAVEAFKLLRIGMANEPKAIEVIDAHIDELNFAIRKATGAA
jgi:hypothetical protein